MAEQTVADPIEPDEPPTEAIGGAEPEPNEATGTGLGPARLTAIVVGVAVAAMIALFAFGGGDGTSEGSDLLGTRAAPVDGELLTGGGTFDIDNHRGSWVLVNFFATWCPPCVAEHPDLVELEAWGTQRGDLQLVSVVFNDPPEAVARFFAQRGGTWPVIDNPAVPIDYRVAQVPETFLVSPSGQIVLHIEGQLVAADIKQAIEGR